MGAAGIYLDYEGQPVDLNDLSWYEKAPCGCFCGVTLAYSDYGSPVRIISTAEQAAEEFWETKREREKYTRLGFTMVLGLRAEVKERLSTGSECPHDPTFGVPPRPQMDGYQWAAVRAYGSNSPLMHLVSDAAIAAYENRDYGSQTKPLCGGKAQFHWSTEEIKWGKVECSRCENKARQAVAS